MVSPSSAAPFYTANGGDISLTFFFLVSLSFSFVLGVFCKQRMNAAVPESPCIFTSLTVCAQSRRFVSYLSDDTATAQPPSLK